MTLQKIELSKTFLFISYLLLCASAELIPSIVARDESTQDVFAAISPSKSLVWQPCFSSFSCAVLDLPLSYKNTAGGRRAFVPLIKSKATTTPHKGMVMTNPGGPGDSAIDFFLSAFPQGIFNAVGTNYDIVAWEPRGIGYSVPLANCSSPSISSRMRKRQHFPLSGPILPDQFFKDTYNDAKAFGEECQAIIGGPNDAGQHMSTTVVVKDMISILNAYANSTDSKGVKNPSLLNYWGFSYGTAIGQEFASIYPDRVGRVVVDGVVDIEDYSSGAFLKDIEDTDNAFSTFFIYCHLAGPSACSFYTGKTARDIFTRFENILCQLDAKNAIKQGWANATLITSSLETLKFVSRVVCYTPIDSFPGFSTLLVAVEDAIKSHFVSPIPWPSAVTEVSEWVAGVACSDNGNVLYNATLDSLKKNEMELEKQSYIAGEVWESTRLGCVGWSIAAEDRYSGPFGSRTKNPILFVSNTRDPATPAVNGKTGKGIFRGAQLLTIDGTGHTSLNTQNACAIKKINSFFQTGTLPGKDNFCKLEAGPWSITIDNILERGLEFEEIRMGVRSLGRGFF